jgi:hypothetical protein
MAKKFTPQVRLTSRDFNSIRNDLIEYAKRYYENVAKDLSKNSSLMFDIETVSYIGDMLSFYLDYTANEIFMDSAVEFDNVVRSAEQLGYKFNPFPASTGVVALFIKVPAGADGLGPDPDYLPKLKKNSLLSSSGGSTFTLLADVDFSDSNAKVVVAEVDSVTGVPTSYAIKMYGEVISGELNQEEFTIGEFQKYLNVRLASSNVTEVVSVFDSEGHEYREVNYLSQDIVYETIPNFDSDKDTVPSILKPVSVPRRFVVGRDGIETFLQFGHGSDSELMDDDVLDPSNVFIKRYGKTHFTDDAFDPTRLLESSKLGISPSNTSLFVTYRVNTNDNVNAGPNSIVNVVSPIFEFETPQALSRTTMSSVVGSLEVTNENPVVGDVTLPSIEELKIRALNNFPTQNRAVTRDDYVAIAYRMPGQFGSIKRCNVVQDPDSFKRNLNMYVIAESVQGTLTAPTTRLKENLKTWLNDYKMINDTINIIDAKVVNFGIEFSILSSLNYDKFDVLEAAKQAIVNKFSTLPEIGEPFYITDVFTALKDVVGVVDVVNVRITNDKTLGGSYSDYSFDVYKNTSADGRRIEIPTDVIYEIKFPNSDIRGEIL